MPQFADQLRMNDLPEYLFANPVWHALQTTHRRFAVINGAACRYPADVAPFAAVAAPSDASLRQLHELLNPGESVWLIGNRYPQVPSLSVEETSDCLQMILPKEVMPPAPTIELAPLSDENAQEMLDLTNRAFPGFFRKRTNEMGAYLGARSAGELVAMGGERLRLDGYAELSGICTHPAYRGKGLATSILWQLARNHRRDGLVSWLHVGIANANAIALYTQLGFRTVRKVILHRLLRTD